MKVTLKMRRLLRNLLGGIITRKRHLYINWDDHTDLHSVNAMFYANKFSYVEMNIPCIPGINPTWSWL